MRQRGERLAEKRMFSKMIIDSDAFLDMSLSAQALYFHLAMRADDDGFLNNAKKIMKIVSASQQDYDSLIEDRFILQFDDGICVIKHWRIHNYLRADRYKETQYREEKSKLYLKKNGAYTLNKDKAVSSLATIGIPDGNQMDTGGQPYDNQVTTGCLPPGDKWLTQDSIDKKSIDKSSIDKYISSESGMPAPNCSDVFSSAYRQ